MDLIYFIDSSDQCPAIPKPAEISVRCYANHGAFLAEQPLALAFVIALEDTQRAASVLMALRQDTRTALHPIFTTQELEAPLAEVSDGKVSSPQEAYERARTIATRLQELDPSAFSGGESDVLRMLGYLYARPDHALTPHRHWSNEQYYAYPALEALIGSGQLVNSRLAGMCDRKLLQRGELVDRLRHCPECDGTHLSFIDVCPHCKQIDIVQKPFLHCFTCGKVAPEERFVEHGALQCPNCKTRLRHIGSDYDRPLENHECLACQHIFIEPEILAHCMHCNVRKRPDELLPRPVYTYELADQGRLAARSGTLEDVFALLDTVNHVSPTYFMNLVNWLMNLAHRHSEERFTVIGIRLKNVLELNAKLGKRAVTELMDALAARLRELVRSTDLTTRTGQQMFWILLPKTGRPENQIVLNRILDLKNLVHPVEGVGLDFETVVFSAPDDMSKGETGKLLLARLEGSLE